MMPTLFLDRDGVINHRIPGDYVKSPESFVPVDGLEQSLSLLAEMFAPLFVVTNQAGIGKGLMTEADLAAVHTKLHTIAANAGATISRIFFCPHTADSGCFCRKPATGMAWLALAEFPDIDFNHSWMVGDSASDIEFGQKLGMKTVLIAGKIEDEAKISALKPDFRFGSLLEFALFCAKFTV